MADTVKILWADDEIDLLKPHLMFLENKGYEVVTVTNGHDAIEECRADRAIDVVFLDESMPGITGIETLESIKEHAPLLPVVMITKNEEEGIMEQALASKIADYLIKPVKPNQILLTLKKILERNRIEEEGIRSRYLQDYRNITMQLSQGLDFREWAEVYRRILGWELEFDQHGELEMVSDMLINQKQEANAAFFKYISRHYQAWVQAEEEAPLLSPNLLRTKLLPLLSKPEPVLLLLLDNMRYDQWKVIEPLISEHFRVEEEDFYYSILPTTTQYSRNAIFAGLMPLEIQKKYPKWWRHDFEEGSKNQFEADLLQEQLQRLVRKEVRFEYIKVTNSSHSAQLPANALNYLNNDLTVVVYNLLDILSHLRNESDMFKELSRDDRAYRSLTRSWFENSSLREMLRNLADREVRIVLTTDHGTIRVNTPSKVVGDRETTTNLRYKMGRNLRYEANDVLAYRDPEDVLLPRPNVSSSFIFAKEDLYFLYPNNYSKYLHQYKDTFQHGGVSLEEVICPVVQLTPR